jgi:hypothetical protein
MGGELLMGFATPTIAARRGSLAHDNDVGVQGSHCRGGRNPFNDVLLKADPGG